ncbi:hypothetical protein BC938DRAFT_479185 [Jimgerdemannia flammicorona]|uniref:Uncharacterized protein n=1 Tax=Jimgerdemannia flammicorona TaxID=994334 RepID=A0A433QLE2_9FUNG|nr:hypothetical protein BC938DRAFT_479185 [Jimgerdemannia flammicorona]
MEGDNGNDILFPAGPRGEVPSDPFPKVEGENLPTLEFGRLVRQLPSMLIPSVLEGMLMLMDLKRGDGGTGRWGLSSVARVAMGVGVRKRLVGGWYEVVECMGMCEFKEKRARDVDVQSSDDIVDKGDSLLGACESPAWGILLTLSRDDPALVEGPSTQAFVKGATLQGVGGAIVTVTAYVAQLDSR